jgi:Got1/Sft2-like family
MGSTLSSTFASMPDLVTKGNRKIGLGLLALGSVFTLLGVSLFFNKTLMRLGNLMFMGGVPMTIGPGRTAGYFFQPKKARATGCLVLGIVLVFVGWPVLGIILEAFGLLNLFGNMFPIFLIMLKQMPIIGPLLKRPPSNSSAGGGGGGGFGRGRREDRDDYYDEDRPYYDDGGDDNNDNYY